MYLFVCFKKVETQWTSLILCKTWPWYQINILTIYFFSCDAVIWDEKFVNEISCSLSQISILPVIGPLIYALSIHDVSCWQLKMYRIQNEYYSPIEHYGSSLSYYRSTFIRPLVEVYFLKRAKMWLIFHPLS